MKISQGLLPLSLLIALAPSVASANYSQPHRAVVGGIDRLYIPGNAGRSPVVISFREETDTIYPLNNGWIRVSNTRQDVVEVAGIVPQGGLVPSLPGSAGDVINAGIAGVYYWSGSSFPFMGLQVVRNRTVTKTSNACGVATFSATATRPLVGFTINGSPVQYSQLPAVSIPSYCRSGVLYVPQ